MKVTKETKFTWRICDLMELAEKTSVGNIPGSIKILSVSTSVPKELQPVDKKSITITVTHE
jgi:hypothetical protein